MIYVSFVDLTWLYKLIEFPNTLNELMACACRQWRWSQRLHWFICGASWL